MLCSDPIFRLNDAKDTLEYNLKRLNDTVNLLQSEITLTKSRAKFLPRMVLTPYEEGKKPLYMQTKFCCA
jgi:hypothetical protein